MDKNKIGERLRELRIEKGETIAEVAKSCDTAPSTIAMYESGERTPRDEIKIRLAKHFKKSINTIFFTE